MEEGANGGGGGGTTAGSSSSTSTATTTAARQRPRYFFRTDVTPVGSTPASRPDEELIGPETPLLLSLLFNVVLIIMLTCLIEVVCLPLLQLVAVKEIDINSKVGRLLVSFLAAFLFVGKVQGAIILFISLITSFLTTDLLGLRGDFVALFLVCFVIIHTLVDHCLQVWCGGGPSSHHHHHHEGGGGGGARWSPVPWALGGAAAGGGGGGGTSSSVAGGVASSSSMWNKIGLWRRAPS